jgi:hypothetical protein
MPKVDMSAEAVTARLKLASELRDLCLLLGTANIERKPEHEKNNVTKREQSDSKKSK